MPEGDTIHRTAATLRSVLTGRELTGFRAPRLSPPFPTPGPEIGEIEARGKHLLVHFGDGLVLHTHMRMTGAWHTYRRGAPWQRSVSQARAVVEVPGVVAVCFRAPVVELLDAGALRRHPALRRLGPDLTVPGVDLDDVVDRMRRAAVEGEVLADLLLDQRPASGIGNVIMQEACFLAGVDPRTPVEFVDEPARRRLVGRAHELLVVNTALTRRTSVPDAPEGTLHVYGRSGQACRACGAVVDFARIGTGARPTYWCPTCQPRPGPLDR
jgi:endonuclease-8